MTQVFKTRVVGEDVDYQRVMMLDLRLWEQVWKAEGRDNWDEGSV